MPELPEVEVTRRRIEPLLIGRRIERAVTTKRSYFFVTPPARLVRELTGRTFTELARHGKYLLAASDDGARLLLHLGMTGQLFASTAHSPRLLSRTARAALAPDQQAAFVPDRHTHLALYFADRGPALFFRDVRKFGKVELLAPGRSSRRLDKLGVDALAAEPESFQRALARRSIPIKTVLLDQSVLAGVGNIYADEALHLAGISPLRPARRVSRAEARRLLAAVQRVLLRSIETGGSSISDYVLPDGSDGAYQDERRVYGKAHMPCPRCGGTIRRRVIAARSSHYCPACQR